METKDKDQVVFYYNRERRLQRANPDAMFAVDHHGVKRPGIIRSLTATRSLRYLFFAMILIIVAVLVVGYAQGARNSGSVAGDSLTVAALWFDGHVYLTVKRTEPWYQRGRSSASDRSPLEIRAGDGSGFSTGILQAGDEELRLRFPAELKPRRIAVIASVTETDDQAADSVELVANVE